MGFPVDCSLMVRTAEKNLDDFEETIQKSLVFYKSFRADYERLQLENAQLKQDYTRTKSDCENENCVAAVGLKNRINLYDQAVKDMESTLAAYDSGAEQYNNLRDLFQKLTLHVTIISSMQDKDSNTSPEKGNSTTEEVSINESLCEIEGTPTGRTSPIIHTKKSRSIVGKTVDKKKLPEEWSTPESKVIKLVYTTPSHGKGNGKGKLKQSRINLMKLKPTTRVDLTCSPEFSGVNVVKKEVITQSLIKKESFENDDTILPSPTSGLPDYTMLKSKSKASPMKFKKPLSLKPKIEKINKENTDVAKEMDESINILNRIPDRLRNIKKENVKEEVKEVTVKQEPMDQDITRCDTQASASLLKQIDMIEDRYVKENCNTPTKRPLCENMNIVNTPPKEDAESSMSILHQNNVPLTSVETVKRKLPTSENVPHCIEPTVRKKAEKRALPGWSCDQCKNFYGTLYKDEPVMLARKIAECSKHRGRHDPARPATPPNFWNPRWTVPEDTEELNRMNNAD